MGCAQSSTQKPRKVIPANGKKFRSRSLVVIEQQDSQLQNSDNNSKRNNSKTKNQLTGGEMKRNESKKIFNPYESKNRYLDNPEGDQMGSPDQKRKSQKVRKFRASSFSKPN